MSEWEVDDPCVEGCEECGAPGDVGCEPGCPNLDFRDAELDAVIGEPDQHTPQIILAGVECDRIPDELKDKINDAS